LIQTAAIAEDMLREVDHVIDVKAPFSLIHAPPPVRRKASARTATPCL
jgi:hypothetical protein